jgi:flagellar assembly protein FliH
MSPRASRISAAKAVSFSWCGPSGAAASPFADAVAPSASARHAQPDPVEQEAHLAVLERDAFAKGYAQGERAGVEAGNRRGDAMLRRLGETLEELASLRQTLLRQSERQLVQLALALARRIVRREIAADDELLTALARVALDRLGDAGQATIRLHPEDFARVATGGAQQWVASHVAVVADTAVSRGGCLVESPFGFVDASIDAQFQELARALLDGEPTIGGAFGELAGAEVRAHV